MSDLLTACAAWRAAETERARDEVRERVRAALQAKHDTEDAGEDLVAFDVAIAAAGAENNENAALKRFEKLMHIPPASVRVLGSGAWRSERPPQPIVWRDNDDKHRSADSVVCRGEVAILTGAGKAGKSHLAVTLAVAAAHARRENQPYGTCCGLRIRAERVVITSYEDAPKRIDQRAEVLGAEANDVLVIAHPEALYTFDRDNRRWRQTAAWRPVWNAIRATEPGLVVLDTGPKAMGGETNDPGAVIGFLRDLEAEARAANTGILITAHDTKAARDATRVGAELDAGAIAGSGQWHDSPRGVMHIVKTGPGDADRLLEAVKCSYGADGWGARLRTHYARHRYAGLTLAERLDESAMLAARAELRAARRKAQNETSRGGAGAQSARGIGRNRPPPGA